jgi:hypothetical protein
VSFRLFAGKVGNGGGNEPRIPEVNVLLNRHAAHHACTPQRKTVHLPMIHLLLFIFHNHLLSNENR